MCSLQVNSNYIFGAQRLDAEVSSLFWPKGGKNKAKLFINIFVVSALF